MFNSMNGSPSNRSVSSRVLVMVVLLCLQLIGSYSMDSTKGPETTSNPSSTDECPPQVYNPVNNIQISYCDPSSGELHECSVNCSSCDKLLPIAKAQLHMTGLILKRLDGISDNTPVVDPSPGTSPPKPTHLPRDCAEVKAAGFNDSGRYTIYPDDGEDPFFVYCDMKTSGGGWTVFQRRQDGSVDFFIKWLDYKYGFGNVGSEHWLGNEKIHRLTSQKTYKLRVDLGDFEGQTRYAEYDQFIVADEELDYQLIIGNYQGTAGDALVYHDGMKFSTRDRDNDEDSAGNCAQQYQGAWWYRACHHSNLNGLYLRGPGTTLAEGINWYQWRGHEYSLRETELKIHPVD